MSLQDKLLRAALSKVGLLYRVKLHNPEINYHESFFIKKYLQVWHCK